MFETEIEELMLKKEEKRSGKIVEGCDRFLSKIANEVPVASTGIFREDRGGCL